MWLSDTVGNDSKSDRTQCKPGKLNMGQIDNSSFHKESADSEVDRWTEREVGKSYADR